MGSAILMKGISAMLLSTLNFCYSCTNGLTLASVRSIATGEAGTDTRKGRFKAVLPYLWKKILTFYCYVMVIIKINVGTF